MDSPNLDRAIRLKSNTMRGGYLENLFVRNVKVGQVADAVVRINLNYDKDRGTHNPTVRNIFIEGITSERSKHPFYFAGLDDSKIRNVVIENCTFKNAAKAERDRKRRRDHAPQLPPAAERRDRPKLVGEFAGFRSLRPIAALCPIQSFVKVQHTEIMRPSDMQLRLRRLLMIAAVCSLTTWAHAITWNSAQRQRPDWFATSEGREVVDNVLLYQFTSGGWPKNIDMAKPLNAGAQKKLARRRDEATIDNRATYSQLRFLARAYSATHDQRVHNAFTKGLDYLLAAQYENGGWPIFYPLREGYNAHIHFNDNSVSGVLELLRDVAEGKTPFDFVDSARREHAATAVEKGIDCILKCQVVVGDRRTAWCAQHDEVTLAPAPARAFEPVSLSGQESVGLIRCLMRVDEPSPEIVAAIRDAMAWLDEVKITGIRVVRINTPEGWDLAVKEDLSARPMWARFYEIGTNRPIFTGRSGVVQYRFDEIERERRTNYAYYGNWPEELLNEEYPAWAAKWHVSESR